MTALCLRFLRDDTGATSIEYALIGALVSVAIIVGATALGSQLNILYDALKTKVATAAS